MRKEYPSLERLQELLEYKDNKFYWKPRGIPSWDGRYAGTEVGHVRDCGYKIIKLDRQAYFYHVIVYMWHNNGECPDFVDHEDGNTLNNDPSNLRPATRAQNNQNAKIRSDNTSGYKGVTWKASRNCWIVRVQVNGVRKEKSGFKTPEEANLVGIKLREELHKEFANHG